MTLADWEQLHTHTHTHCLLQWCYFHTLLTPYLPKVAPNPGLASKMGNCDLALIHSKHQVFQKSVSTFLLDKTHTHLTSISVCQFSPPPFPLFSERRQNAACESCLTKRHKSCKAIEKARSQNFPSCVRGTYDLQRKPHRCMRNGHWLLVAIHQEGEKEMCLLCRTRTSRWVHCRIHRFFCRGGLTGACSELPLHPSSWRTPRCFVPTLPMVEENRYYHGRALESM